MAATQARDDGLLIGGRWRASDRLLDRRNPARPNEVVGRTAAASVEDVAEAYAAARAAAAGWAATPAPARGEILRRAGDLVDRRTEEIAVGLALEEGKALRDARAEVQRAAVILRYHAGEGRQAIGEVYPSAASGTMLHTQREPLGVVAVITPWNFPIAIPAWKLAPALVYGNALVWKPAEIASGSAVRLAEVLHEAGLPAGVLNLVTGKGSEIGDALVTAPEADGVTFTGSNAVGRRIGLLSAERGLKSQLELGGKNPSVVLADADLERAVQCIVRSAMYSTGQRCTATSRVIAERAVADELVERLVATASALVVGDPVDEGTEIGPLASAAQHRTVADYLALAPQEGHVAVCGGTVADPSDGYFASPTVLIGGSPTSRVATEEIFGPVTAVLAVDDAAEALRLANATPFGLSASVFTRDLNAALRAANELEVGVVHINGETAGAEPHVPFGGIKGSGSGSREQGTAARDFFTETKTIYIEDVT